VCEINRSTLKHTVRLYVVLQNSLHFNRKPEITGLVSVRSQENEEIFFWKVSVSDYVSFTSRLHARQRHTFHNTVAISTLIIVTNVL